MQGYRLPQSGTRQLVEYEEYPCPTKIDGTTTPPTQPKKYQTLNYFQQSALKNAAVLYQNADLQFNNGAINFLEWTMLVNQSISLQSGYIDALNEYNKTVIELNAYSPNFLNKRN